MELPYRNHPYWAKDQFKAARCNKYIGQGTAKSSTQYYADNLPEDIVNCGWYEQSDIVFISVEGNRAGRLLFDEDEINIAIQAGAKFITDNKANRNRDYNVGERELAKFLELKGYSVRDFAQGAVWFQAHLK